MVRQETCRGNRLLWGTTSQEPFWAPEAAPPPPQERGAVGWGEPPTLFVANEHATSVGAPPLMGKGQAAGVDSVCPSTGERLCCQ